MSAFQWILKILIVLSGTYLAVVAVATETRILNTDRPWYRSLNRYGIGAVVAAAVLLLATVANEYLTADAAMTGSTEARTHGEQLLSKLETSRALTDEALEMARRNKEESDLFKGMLEATEVVAGRATISMASIDPRGIHQVESMHPDEGDRVSWQLQCGNEARWRAVQTSECTTGVLGILGGSGRHYALRTTTGSVTMTGRGQTEPLTYHTANGHCRPVDEELRLQQCVLSIEHIVSGRKMARQVIEARLGGRPAKAEDDFCRHYRLLHGEPCMTPEQIRSRQETPQTK